MNINLNLMRFLIVREPGALHVILLLMRGLYQLKEMNESQLKELTLLRNMVNRKLVIKI